MSAFLSAGGGPYLPLYLVTLALHAVFVSYLVGGTLYVLFASAAARRRDRPRSPLASHIASWLPLTMGAAITAGVAPILFLQLLHQRAFYTANLLLGPVWFAMIPSLIAGFYLLYLHKSRPLLRPALVLGLAALCFTVVACLWSWNHRVMTTPEQWAASYASSVPAVYGLSWLPRAPLWLGGMLAQFAVIALWQATRLADERAAEAAPADENAPPCPTPIFLLAALALAGRALSILGAALLGWPGALLDGEPLVLLLTLATALDVAAWILLALRHAARARVHASAAASARTVRSPDNASPAPAAVSSVASPLVPRGHLVLLAATATLTLTFATLVRELPRLSSIRPLPTAVQNAGGAWVFALFSVFAVIAFTLIFRAIRRAAPEVAEHDAPLP